MLSRFQAALPLFGLIAWLSATCTITGLPAAQSSLYIHQAWQFEDGLPQNVVQAIHQTRDGYIWVGTQNGLARFDGVQFTVYNSRNTPELKSSNIGALLETQDGSFWIGTEGGGLVQMKDGKFKCFSTTDGLAGDIIRCLYEARDGTLWIGSRGEKNTYILTRFKEGRFQAITELNDFRNHAVRAISEDNSGVIWVATSKGIVRWQNENATFEPHMYLRTVFTDSKGQTWFSSNGGMWRNGQKYVFTSKDGLADSNVSTLFEDSSGTLWIGSFGGLTRMKDGKFYLELNKESISYDAVNAIFEDRENNIWIGAKDGLSRLSRRIFFSYTKDEGLAHNNVMTVLEDNEGSMWMGTWGGGLNRLTDGTFTAFAKPQGLQNDLVLAVHQARDGTIWFGNDYTGGLHKFENGIVTKIVADDLPPITVRAILEDKKGNLWIGAHLGLIQWKDESQTFDLYTINNGLPADLIKVLHEDKEGALWIGTMEGLSRFQDGIFSTFNTDHGLASKNIISLFEDTSGTLWVGTVGGGLSRLSGDRFTTYTTQHGLFTDDIWEILEDDSGSLWMSSRVGVFRVLKSDFDRFDQGEISNIPYASFGKYDGMISIECNSVAKPAAWKSRDGRLWFATAKGLSVLDPKSEAVGSDTPPAVLIEHIMAGKERLQPAEQIRLAPNQRDLEFHYTGLSFRAPQRVKFKYRLEGVDQDWVEAGSRRVAFYNNLKPGNYRFHVVACNSHGFWNQSGASTSLTLAPYYYQTFGFYALCAAGVLFFGGTAYQVRVRHLKKREQQLKALVAERTQTLEAEIAKRQQIQTKLIDLSRKAGMAEVASGVLHNVGNVLNSVNVSATLAADRIRTSKISRIDQAADLMAAHADDLPGFAASDKGKQLPGYLKKLARHLAEEQQAVIAELHSLRKNIDHIKNIVAMQQSLAKASGVVETVRLNDLAEDALQMNLEALESHGVQIVRDYGAEVEIVVEKHKVLQILINIIRNAKHACIDSGQVDKRIVLTTAEKNPEIVQIRVQDNGIGISPENLARIFSHGFTTRATGHGFGLHSAALAAREIGGCLSVSSDGLGKGAAFVLEIPVRRQADQKDSLSAALQ